LLNPSAQRYANRQERLKCQKGLSSTANLTG
jgi:hypothetical protein